MYDIRWIRENAEVFDQGLKNRNAEPLSSQLLAIDDRRRVAIARAQTAQERRNALSKEIGQAMAAKDQARAEALKAEVAALKHELALAEFDEKTISAELDKALAIIPNMALGEVPVGVDEHGNVLRSAFGTPRNFDFTPRQHFEIGEDLGLMDFEAATRMSGARFVVNKGGLARLERALGQFMLDLQTTQNGYLEVNPPILVRDEAMFGTAQLPKFEDDLFFTDPRTPEWNQQMAKALEMAPSATVGQHKETYSREEVQELLKAVGKNVAFTFVIQDQFSTGWRDERPLATRRYGLIPTAEVPLTNLVREQILEEKQLPLRFTALTPCFRAEAGSAGRDTRGMIRQHQFYKVELVAIATPETSAQEHEHMLASAEMVLQKLELPYRVMTLCTGDMGFASQKTYDIEVWLPGQNMYREISSCSVCGDFQARRMNARFRPAEGKGTRFVHTLNGSALAVGRTLVAVLENYQNEDGSVTVPTALLPYMGGLTKIEKAR
jgi:seryl-tRNA synthetase